MEGEEAYCYNADMEKRTAAWRVIGRVQGVGFRYFVVRQASALGLAGWTKNLWDGSVEVQAAGAPDMLALMRDALLEGPPHARVDRLEELAPSRALENARGFTIEF